MYICESMALTREQVLGEKKKKVFFTGFKKVPGVVRRLFQKCGANNTDKWARNGLLFFLLLYFTPISLTCGLLLGLQGTSVSRSENLCQFWCVLSDKGEKQVCRLGRLLVEFRPSHRF
jgi:hypothetical protein